MVANEQRVINQRTGAAIATKVKPATGVWGSFKGLMLQSSLAEGAGLLFRPARGVHTHFMRFPIDLIFLDREDRVTRVREGMVPWRWDFSQAAALIELNAGVARGHDLRVGDRLQFEPARAIDVAAADRHLTDPNRS